jgi:predicted ATPase
MAILNPHLVWRVRLLNGPVLEHVDGFKLTKFRSTKVRDLLSILALRLGRQIPRSELQFLLWPDEDDEQTIANRFRVTLSQLRQVMEPRGVIAGSVLDTSLAGCLSLNSKTVWCDVTAFDELYAAKKFDEASALIEGSLLPACYEDWAFHEQARLDLRRTELENMGFLAGPPRAESLPSTAPRTSFSAKLPLYLNRFLGRERELETLGQLIQSHRFVTIIGAGGIGKTRIAVEYASRLDQPSLFVSMERLGTAEEAAQKIGAALGMKSPTLESLAESFQAEGDVLLILDNAESVSEGLAEMCIHLLDKTDGLRILATSRQVLGGYGEVLLRLNKLSLVNAGEDGTALELFVDRARASRPDFNLTPHHRDSVMAICSRLDGIPLAIELAAGRIASQSPSQIAASLETGVLNLKAKIAGLAVRQQTLRQLISSSYDDLTEPARHALEPLSMFQGPISKMHATGLTSPEVLEELVHRSMVYTLEEGDEYRYSVLRPIAEYVLEADQDKLSTLKRFADPFLRAGSAVDENDVRTFRPLDNQVENLTVLCLDPQARAIPGYWSGLAGFLLHAFVRGDHVWAARWIDANTSHWGGASYEDRQSCRLRACRILTELGRITEAKKFLLEACQEANEAGDEESDILATVDLGLIEERYGDWNLARQSLERALVRARTLENPNVLETCLSHLSGALHGVHPEHPGFEEAIRECETLAQELLNLVGPWSRRRPLGSLLLTTALLPQNRFEESLRAVRDCQADGYRIGGMTEIMYAFATEAYLAHYRGEFLSAAYFMGAYTQFALRLGNRTKYQWTVTVDASLADIQELGARASLEELIPDRHADLETHLRTQFMRG